MKVTTNSSKNNDLLFKVADQYDHYIALDWSLDNVTLARMRPSSARPKTLKLEPQVKLVKEYAQKCHGSTILCIEETTGSHWLYVELKDYFDRIIVCDPYRNALLS